MGGVSFIELLLMYELWLGLEAALPEYRRRERSIAVTAAPVTAGTVIWRSCRFIGALFRALVDLPDGVS